MAEWPEEDKKRGNVVPLRQRNLLERANQWRPSPSTLENRMLADRMKMADLDAQEAQRRRNEVYGRVIAALRENEEALVSAIKKEIEKGNSRMYVIAGGNKLRPSERADADFQTIIADAVPILGIEVCAGALQKWLLAKPGRFYPKSARVEVDPEKANTTRGLWLTWE